LDFNKTDYETIGEIQTLLDISAQESANLVKTFYDIGGGVDKISEFVVSLIKNSNLAGVQSRDVLKDFEGYMKASNIARFHGGVDDISKMMAYSKRIRVDMGGMFDLMDSVSDPGAATDLVQQLQALDISFLGLDPMEVTAAAQTDWPKFTHMILDPIRKNIGKYFDSKTGQIKFFAAKFTEIMMKFPDFVKLFKTAGDFGQHLAKVSREQDLYNQLLGSQKSSEVFGLFDKDKQEDLLGILSANFANGKVNGKKITSYTYNDFKSLLDVGLPPGEPRNQIEESVKGTVSVEDQLKVNENLVKSMSWSVESINAVSELLKSDDYVEALKLASNSIMDIGRMVMNDETMRKIQILTDYAGINTKLAYVFTKVFTKSIEEGQDLISSAYKYQYNFMMDIAYEVGLVTKPNKKPMGGVLKVLNTNQPTPTTSFPKMSSPSINNKILFNLLSSFTTNKFGPGIMSQTAGGTTNIVVSGEIRNKINEKDAGIISGEKILEILKEKMV
jgi:hypothetical protein